MTVAPDPLFDRHVQVETPEHVAVGYELADLGSRCAALLLDLLILVGILLGTWLIGIALLAGLSSGAGGAALSLGLSVLILVGFVLLWGYFIYFEGLRDGQTPGKRALGLRVIQDGGYPVGLREALVRNLLRLIDVMPPPTWLLGAAVMMLHPRTKRVGDLVAGTVVVRERGDTSLPEEVGGGESTAPPRLGEEEFSALSRYSARREQLQPEVRAKVSRQILASLAERIPADAQRTGYSPDVLLTRLYADEARRRAARGRAAGSAQAAALLRQQRHTWAAYRALLDRAGGEGLAKLPEERVSEFAALYRETAADLARARAYGASPELVYTLERWVGAGHNLLYRPGVRSALHFTRWLARGFPALVRRRWAPISLAGLLLFGPMLATGIAVFREPGLAREILPAEMMARAEEGATRRSQGLGYVEVPELGMPMLASQLIANNVQVTFGAFAGGVLAGLGTLAVLVLNGVFIGSVFGLFAAQDLTGYLLAFVLPHGVVELTAICIAGGAGLWLGSALLVPGRVTRGEALVTRGREAVALLGGTGVLLVVAGLIEGFISPAPFPLAVKAAVSAASALLLWGYLARAGRGPAAQDQSSARPFTSR
jgi:uncharacterized membrane protein SpoIIM required for sporulation/uncharacterized RDD family membrane protein YckC